jgi:hypothetical protein
LTCGEEQTARSRLFCRPGTIHSLLALLVGVQQVELGKELKKHHNRYPQRNMGLLWKT